jgi:hypothetical protein
VHAFARCTPKCDVECRAVRTARGASSPSCCGSRSAMPAKSRTCGPVGCTTSPLPRSRLDLFPLRSIRSKTRGAQAEQAELQRLRYSNGTPGTPTAVAARGGVPAVDRARVHQIGREHVKRDGDARHGAEPERAPMEPDTWRCDATRRLQCCIECPFRRVAAVISTNSADTADGNGLSTRAIAPALA